MDQLRKKPPTLERKKSRSRDNTSSVPPIGTPSWCLSQQALERFNRSNVNIPVYDCDTDNSQDNNDNDTEDESNGEEEIPNRKSSSKKKKRKTKKKSKQKKIRNINQNNSIYIYFFYVNAYYNLVLNRFTLLNYIINHLYAV